VDLEVLQEFWLLYQHSEIQAFFSKVTLLFHGCKYEDMNVIILTIWHCGEFQGKEEER